MYRNGLTYHYTSSTYHSLIFRFLNTKHLCESLSDIFAHCRRTHSSTRAELAAATREFAQLNNQRTRSKWVDSSSTVNKSLTCIILIIPSCTYASRPRQRTITSPDWLIPSASVALPMALYKYVYDYDYMIITSLIICFFPRVKLTNPTHHPLKFAVVTLYVHLTRDLLAIAKFLVLTVLTH